MNTFKEFKQDKYKAPPYDFMGNHKGFAFHRNAPGYSDIAAHLPLLEYLGSKCKHITEFGTRDGFSTSAFIAGLSKNGGGKLVSCDIQIPSFLEFFDSIELPCLWQFIQRSTVDPSLEIEETDLLFVDSLHTYSQVKSELELHSGKVAKNIAFHDTYSHGKFSRDVEGEEGILKSINEFLETNQQWEKVYDVDFNHGLIVLEKIQDKT